jgi:hypothetical protein
MSDGRYAMILRTEFNKTLIKFMIFTKKSIYDLI